MSPQKLVGSLICFVLVLRGFPGISSPDKNAAGARTKVSSTTDASSSISRTLDPRPRGIRLAIIGDSVSRYHYLYLAYFLRYGEWYQAPPPPPSNNTNNDATITTRKNNIVNEKTFSSWNAFYNHTNALLRPSELCDCFRRSATTNANLMVAHENRYFHDSKLIRDNRLVYIQAFGHQFPTHGTLEPSTILNRIPNATFRIVRGHHVPNFTWSYSDWSDVVLHHLQDLSITHVLLNGGLWATRWSDTTEQQHFLDALQATNMTGIWRTTTNNSDHVLIEPDTNDAMVQLFQQTDSSRASRTRVLDASWTKAMKKSVYWDGVHFSEGPYQVLSEDLLEQVLHHEFPTGYVKFDRTTLC